MKRYILIALGVVGIFATACSTTTFTEYRGQGVVEGKGGTVRKVDGIDFWENGEPDRKYRILGVIDDSREDSPFLGSSVLLPGKDGVIAKLARERGGDAVILSVRDREIARVSHRGTAHYSGGGTTHYHGSGTARYREMTKMTVVKYVD